jgi:hypothetical protein
MPKHCARVAGRSRHAWVTAPTFAIKIKALRKDGDSAPAEKIVDSGRGMGRVEEGRDERPGPVFLGSLNTKNEKSYVKRSPSPWELYFILGSLNDVIAFTAFVTTFPTPNGCSIARLPYQIKIVM